MENTMECKNCNNVLEITLLEEIQINEQLCENCFNEYFAECEDCGEHYAKDGMTNINNNYYVCNVCLDNNYFECSECGEYHKVEDKIEVEFLSEWKNVCQECVDWHDNKYFYCNDCGNYKAYEDYEQEEIYDVDRLEYIYMCESCKELDPYIFYCEYHERYERAESTFDINNYGEICWRAYESGEFSSCEDCEEHYHIDDLEYNENDECMYCSECIEDHQGHIKSYHDHKIEHIRENKILSLDNIITMGVELEVESSGNTECWEMSNILYDNSNDFFVYESDSSLKDGFEIITRPYDLEYYNEEGKQIFINALELLQNNKFRSHDGGRCGLHVHIGRHGLGNSYQERINTIRKINIITEYFSPELTILSRRAAEKLNHWARFGTYGMDRENLTIDKLNEIHENNRGRYSALNLNNESTIEFRFFRGTLKKESFLSAIELTYNICSWCIDNEIKELEKLDFYSIVTYKLNEYIGDYLTSKGIEKNEVVLV